MTPAEFLKKELNILATKFPGVHIKYGFNNKIDMHIVELLPLIEYSNNKELDKSWFPVSINFMEIYKDEEIAFISSDSSLSLKDVIFEFNHTACREENIITELFGPLTKEFITYSYSFPTSMPNGRIISPSIVKFLDSPIEKIDESHILDNSYLHAA